jgi:hypothetical protein
LRAWLSAPMIGHRRDVAFARFSGELRALKSIALCNGVPDVTFSIVMGAEDGKLTVRLEG